MPLDDDFTAYIFARMVDHELYMRRCLQLAKNGLGTTYPNPLVGCVIVLENQIIAEGWHRKSGTPHAEVNAINAARTYGYTEQDFKKGTLYVNLEPCSHTGKTPPCADRIISENFKKVVVGTLDPHAKVAGKGIKKLTDAGIAVKTGVLPELCNELNKRFFTFHREKRPYIILKWAESEDGFIAPNTRPSSRPVWITNKRSRQLSHKLRSDEHAILIGAYTFIQDSPKLSTRDWYGTEAQKFVATDGKRNLELPPEFIPIDDSLGMEEMLLFLYDKGIQSIIIEGGTRTIQRFIKSGIWDEAHRFIGTTKLLKDGVKAPELTHQQLMNSTIINNDLLKIYSKK
ncbi:MAG: bifunctional diaminohydroxyphosphoribosylaminopyrimidine deaminase/5-amino-6-(5-phosphoribosylamino)uracil reductase RibD [Nonlabens sp.]